MNIINFNPYKTSSASRSNRSRGCPDWLARKFASARFSYIFTNGVVAASLEDIRWSHDDGGYVGIYKIDCYNVGNLTERWVERYTWGHRDNRMYPIKQRGVRHVPKRLLASATLI